MMASLSYGSLPLQHNERCRMQGQHTLYPSQTKRLSGARYMGKHVHKPWNSCHSIKCTERAWTDRNRDNYASSFDVHRPLKTAFYDPPYHPEWKITTLGNKLVTSTTDEFRQFAQESAWDIHRPLKRGLTLWQKRNNAYSRAAYATCVGMSSSFEQ